MVKRFDVDYYSERARQERALAERAAHPAAASAHDELAQLYEEVSKVGTRTSTRMSPREEVGRAHAQDNN